jgi:hypothetical protein
MLVAVVISALSLNSFASGVHLYGQISNNLLSQLPKNLRLRENTPQRYKVYCDYFNLDALGNLSGKQRVIGEYTRALPGGRSRWENVRIASAKGFDDPFPEGESQKYMDGLTYSSVSDEIFNERFFHRFPPAEAKTRNLIWDMRMIEQFSWDYFDKLELNQPFTINSNPEDVPLGGIGTFQNRKIVLTWMGISRRNNETCALIRYQAFDNKFTTSVGTMSFQGRSHYWGEIWVSLEDKQIEYATLFEDVLVQYALPGQSTKQLIDVFREGAFEKSH